METDFRNGIILNSINELQNVKKMRPDRDRIISYAAKKYGLNKGPTTNSENGQQASLSKKHPIWSGFLFH